MYETDASSRVSIFHEERRQNKARNAEAKGSFIQGQEEQSDITPLKARFPPIAHFVLAIALFCSSSAVFRPVVVVLGGRERPKILSLKTC